MTEVFSSQSFQEEELSSALGIARQAAVEVADTLKYNFGTRDFETKHGDERDWVTHWDGWAEGKIAQRLDTFSKDVGFCGEESGTAGDPEVYWTTDPIDGTSHFVRGSDFCTSMIALVDHGVPVASVIHDFIRGDTYTALIGQGAFKNSTERLQVSNRPMSAAYLELYTDEKTPQGQTLRSTIEKTGAYLLRSAATGFTLTQVARGSTEGFVSLHNPYGAEWDIAPGSLLIHEAGGIVRNIGSTAFSTKNFDLIAANPPVFAALDGLVARHMDMAETTDVG